MRGAGAAQRDRIPPGTLPAGGYLRHIIGVNVCSVKLIDPSNLIENNYHWRDLTRIAVKPACNLDEKKTGPWGPAFHGASGNQRFAAASVLRCMARVMDHCWAIDSVLLTHQ